MFTYLHMVTFAHNAAARKPLPPNQIVMRLSSLVVVTPLLTGWAPALGAQTTPWISRHQHAVWLATFVDQPLRSRWSLWLDGQWRRVDTGRQPQQLLIRPGVQITVAPGVRLGAGYGYIATAPYGALPIANPTREHRSWQQLSLTHNAGALSISHRYRLEQRWLTAVRPHDPFNGRVAVPTTYANRARYLGRVQGPLAGIRLRTLPVLAFAWDELLMPIGGSGASLQVTQNRAAVGIGVPLDARHRIEIGYMNLWNAFAARRANEVNHTLTVSWLVTPRPPRKQRPSD